MGHNSVPMLPISNPIGPVGPVANCLNRYPEKSGFRIRKIRKSGFFESCRARYGLSIRTYEAKMSFSGKILDRHLLEENGQAYFETEEVYSTPFGA